MSDAGPDTALAETLAERGLQVDGTEWIARSAGLRAAGTGSFGLAAIEAVWFVQPGGGGARRLALVARGAWLGLYDEELARLLRSAVPVVPAAEPGPGAGSGVRGDRQ
ncbi:MAG: hypothetical protein FIB01_05710 [Gemmatimonadetes bacterium]|nr:hypothetical protein [Gemmatimonadota bacterium]